MTKSQIERRQTLAVGPSLWLAGALFAAAVALYINTVSFGFVFDDVTLILQNPQVTQQRWGEILGRSGYRPVRTLTYVFNYLIGGRDPFGYHLFNVLLHAFNVVLVYFFCWNLSRSRIVAGSAGILFAAHPVQTAAVAYVSGRKDLLATFFVLLGLLAYFSYRRTSKPPALLSTVLFFLLAVLSKEVAIVFPVLLVLLDVYLTNEALVPPPAGTTASGLWPSLWRSIHRSPILYAVYGVLSVAALYYAVVLTQASRQEHLWGGSLQTHLGTSFKLFAHYLRLILVPYPLIADYTGGVFPLSGGLLEPATAFSFFLLLGYCGLLLWIYRYQPMLAFGMAWFLVTLLPVLQIIPFHEIAADHFLYLPSIGIALVAGVVQRLVLRERMEILGWGVLALITGVFAFATVERSRIWKNERSLWERTYEQAPSSYRANLNLGYFLFREGQWQKSLELTRRSAELSPARALPWSNLGAMHRERGFQAIRSGDLKAAEAFENQAVLFLQKSIDLSPSDPLAYSNLGDAFKDLGSIWERRRQPANAQEARRAAIENFKRAVEIGADREIVPALWQKLGMVYVDQGLYEEALPYLERAVDRLPDLMDLVGSETVAQSFYWTAFCYFQVKNYRQSASYFEQTARLQPAVEVFTYWALSHENLGETGKAIEVMTIGLRTHPESPQLHYNMGALYLKVGEEQKALEQWELALRANPEAELAIQIQKSLAQIRSRTH